MRTTYIQRLMASAALSFVVVGAAAAQDQKAAADTAQAAAPQLGEVIVTAEHRKENVQKTPIPVDVVSSVVLKSRNVTTDQGLALLVPALDVGPAAGSYEVYYLRGVGVNANNGYSDPAIATNLNGVFIDHSFASVGNLYDIDHIEVLKGPQGTLYGRNATGGVINIIYAKPTYNYGGDLSVTAGNYASFQTDGDVNIPLGDKAAIRGAFETIKHTGYMSDGTDDHDSQAGRLQLRLDPTDDLNVVIGGDYYHAGGYGGDNAVLCASSLSNTPPGTCNTFSASQRVGLADSRVQAIYATIPGVRAITLADSHINNVTEGLQAAVNWKTPYGVLTVIPAVRQSNENYSDAQGGVTTEVSYDLQDSVEARFSSTGNGKFQYTTGLYYLKDYIHSPLNLNTPLIVGANTQTQAAHFRQTTTTEAAFADATYALVDTFKLIGGVRYTMDEKSYNAKADYIQAVPTFSEVLSGDQKTNAFTYRVGAEWNATPTTLVYATVATGEHSGGFYLAEGTNTYQPEKLISYTLGAKNRFFENKLQLNLEIFDWRYSNQQVSGLTVDSIGNLVFATVNAGNSDSKGAEIGLSYRLTPTTQIDSDYQYLDSKYSNFAYGSFLPPKATSLCTGSGAFFSPTGGKINCTGQPLLGASKNTFNLGVDQTIHLANGGKIVGRLSGVYRSGAYFNINYQPSAYQPGYTTGNLSLGYYAPDDKWAAELIATNFTNVAAFNNVFTQNVTSVTLIDPRLIQVRLSTHF